MINPDLFLCWSLKDNVFLFFFQCLFITRSDSSVLYDKTWNDLSTMQKKYYFKLFFSNSNCSLLVNVSKEEYCMIRHETVRRWVMSFCFFIVSKMIFSWTKAVRWAATVSTLSTFQNSTVLISTCKMNTCQISMLRTLLTQFVVPFGLTCTA